MFFTTVSKKIYSIRRSSKKRKRKQCLNESKLVDDAFGDGKKDESGALDGDRPCAGKKQVNGRRMTWKATETDLHIDDVEDGKVTRASP